MQCQPFLSRSTSSINNRNRADAAIDMTAYAVTEAYVGLLPTTGDKSNSTNTAPTTDISNPAYDKYISTVRNFFSIVNSPVHVAMQQVAVSATLVAHQSIHLLLTCYTTTVMQLWQRLHVVASACTNAHQQLVVH